MARPKSKEKVRGEGKESKGKEGKGREGKEGNKHELEGGR